MRPPDHQRGLTEPAGSGHHQHSWFVVGAGQRLGQRGQFVFTAGEMPNAGRHLRRVVFFIPIVRQGRHGVAVRSGMWKFFASQDHGVQPIDVRTRVAAQFFGKPVTQCLVSEQRVGAAVAAVQREHQLSGQSLSQRVSHHRCHQLADEFTVPAQSQFDVETFLLQCDFPLTEPGAIGLQTGSRHTVQWLTPPHVKGLSQ
jgi:hypothetical protein